MILNLCKSRPWLHNQCNSSSRVIICLSGPRCGIIRLLIEICSVVDIHYPQAQNSVCRTTFGQNCSKPQLQILLLKNKTKTGLFCLSVCRVQWAVARCNVLLALYVINDQKKAVRKKRLKQLKIPNNGNLCIETD